LVRSEVYWIDERPLEGRLGEGNPAITGKQSWRSVFAFLICGRGRFLVGRQA
jgi:hypothetical protein